jgi:Na+/melibiose symporter-like transporter
MIEDRELDAWREQWDGVAESSPGFQSKILRRIKLQEQRFVLGNVLTGIVFAGMLIFAGYLRRQSNWLGTGWATGLCVLVFVSIGYRLWVLRQTWRSEAQSTRAFVELWQRRVLARLLLLRISIYVSIGWLIFCAALTAANWTVIGRDVKVHPKDWIEVLILSIVMQPVLWYWATWIRRRKTAELNEVNRILDEMNG